MIKLNGYEIPVTIFPDNTSQVWKLNSEVIKYIEDIRNESLIEWKFENESELIRVCQLKMLIDKVGSNGCSLRIDYLPYGRQDKDISNEQTFALHSFSLLINAMKFNNVYSYDVHNVSKTEQLINNFNNIEVKLFINKVIEKFKPDIICYPDKGALERYNKYNNNLGVVCVDKVRDQKTGNIIDIKINTKEVLKNKRILMIDDICDGGRTFVNIANILKRETDYIGLYTTHGIYSNGLEYLLNNNIIEIFSKEIL